MVQVKLGPLLMYAYSGGKCTKVCSSMNVIPVMNVAFIVPNRNSNISDFSKIKMWVILVVVRSDPPYPHSTGFLSGKHPD